MCDATLLLKYTPGEGDQPGQSLRTMLSKTLGCLYRYFEAVKVSTRIRICGKELMSLSALRKAECNMRSRTESGLPRSAVNNAVKEIFILGVRKVRHLSIGHGYSSQDHHSYVVLAGVQASLGIGDQAAHLDAIPALGPSTEAQLTSVGAPFRVRRNTKSSIDPRALC